MKLRKILTGILIMAATSLFGAETINHQVNYLVQPTINNSDIMTINGDGSSITNISTSNVLYPAVTTNIVSITTNLIVTANGFVDPDYSGTYRFKQYVGGFLEWTNSGVGDLGYNVGADYGFLATYPGIPPTWLQNPPQVGGPIGNYDASDSATGSYTVAYGDIITNTIVVTNKIVLGSASTNNTSDFVTTDQGNNAFLIDGSRSGQLSAWGSNMTIANIISSAYGASQYGFKSPDSTMTIGAGSVGANQRGSNLGAPSSMTIGQNAFGSSQQGYNSGGGQMSIGYQSYGNIQHVWNVGTLTMLNYVVGSCQRGYNLGVMSMFDYTSGSCQQGKNSGVVSNLGANGSIQLFDLASGTTSLVTSAGSASIVLGAGTSSNKNCIVAGDGSVSHGNGSITAGNGFYGSAYGLTNFPVSFSPYVIPYASSNNVSPSNGTYQYYQPTGISTMYFPTAYATNVAWGFVLDVKVNTNVYAFTIFTNNVCFGTNDYPGNGVTAFLNTIRTNDVSTLTIYKAYNSINWRIQ